MAADNMDAVRADIERRVRGILASEAPLPRSVEIYHTLHIAGDDAVELLEGIANTYGTSFQGFRFSEYFPDEPFAVFLFWKSRLGLPDRRRRSFTLEHLIAVVQLGSWFDPPASRT